MNGSARLYTMPLRAFPSKTDSERALCLVGAPQIKKTTNKAPCWLTCGSVHRARRPGIFFFQCRRSLWLANKGWIDGKKDDGKKPHESGMWAFQSMRMCGYKSRGGLTQRPSSLL